MESITVSGALEAGGANVALERVESPLSIRGKGTCSKSCMLEVWQGAEPRLLIGLVAGEYAPIDIGPEPGPIRLVVRDTASEVDVFLLMLDLEPRV